MYDDHDRFDHPRRDPEASPVACLPRLAGDEVDEERLIARLHAAVARETGPFGVPWWQAPWLRGGMVTTGLLLATLIGLNIGRQLPANPDVMLGGINDPVIAHWDREYAQSPEDPRWLEALDATADLIGDHARAANAAQLLTYDPAYQVTGRQGAGGRAGEMKL